MKKKIPLIIVLIIFIVGVGVMSYPLFSSVINNMVSRSSVSDYTEKTKSLGDEKINELFAQAQAYNKTLTNNVILTDPFDEKAYESLNTDYEGTFDIDGKGLIGYVEVPKINVYLPISHSTSEKVLSKGAGHLQNTSFPIGGKNTHSVISAHTGYPTETFFDYLTDMKKGDCFYIHVLDRVLKYEVDDISVVLPSDTSKLRIVNGEDHVTLLTCTPYGVNSHRLLVRGKRVVYNKENGSSSENISSVSLDKNCIYFLGYKIPYWVAGIVMAVFVLLVILVVLLILRKNKRKKQIDDKKENLDTDSKNDLEHNGTKNRKYAEKHHRR